MGDFDMTEVSKFAADLAAAPAVVGAALPLVEKRRTEEMAAGARSSAPRDRPWLATQGIEVVRSEDGEGFEMVSGLDPRGNPVALLVDGGTVRHPPNPFMTSQLDRVGPMFVADIEQVVDRAVG